MATALRLNLIASSVLVLFAPVSIIFLPIHMHGLKEGIHTYNNTMARIEQAPGNTPLACPRALDEDCPRALDEEASICGADTEAVFERENQCNSHFACHLCGFQAGVSHQNFTQNATQPFVCPHYSRQGKFVTKIRKPT